MRTEVIVRSRVRYPGRSCEMTNERAISWSELKSATVGAEALLDEVREQVEAELRAHIEEKGHD